MVATQLSGEYAANITSATAAAAAVMALLTALSYLNHELSSLARIVAASHSVRCKMRQHSKQHNETYEHDETNRDDTFLLLYFACFTQTCMCCTQFASYP
jgi:mevalonate pyrophosphate decarboxylase